MTNDTNDDASQPINQRCPRCGYVTTNVFACPTCRDPMTPFGHGLRTAVTDDEIVQRFRKLELVGLDYDRVEVQTRWHRGEYRRCLVVRLWGSIITYDMLSLLGATYDTKNVDVVYEVGESDHSEWTPGCSETVEIVVFDIT